MRYTNIFPNPVDDGFLRFTIDSNPKEHLGYSEHIDFNPKIHQQWIQRKWDLKDGEMIIRFLHIRGGRTKTMVKYQEDNKFSCKMDDVDTSEGDYHIEVNGKRVEEHIERDKNLHPALFCLFKLLDELVKRKDENIPAYFFLEEQIKRRPDIVNILINNKPKNANITRYCYAVAFTAEKNERKMDLRLTSKWIEERLLPAIKQVNESFQKNGFVKIPWTKEQRIFPIPVIATESSQIILESRGKESPKIPKFFSDFKR